jgi:hypothetical protein
VEPDWKVVEIAARAARHSGIGTLSAINPNWRKTGEFKKLVAAFLSDNGAVVLALVQNPLFAAHTPTLLKSTDEIPFESKASNRPP